MSRLSAGIISAKTPWTTIPSPASTRRIKPDVACYQYNCSRWPKLKAITDLTSHITRFHTEEVAGSYDRLAH